MLTTQPTVMRHLHQSMVVTQTWRDCPTEGVVVVAVACVVAGNIALLMM